MRESLKNKCRLFIDNRDAFKRAFPAGNSYLYPSCAAIFTNADRLADVDTLKEARRILRSRVNAFSNFRSSCELPIIAMLAISDEPEKRIDETVRVYGLLKEHFWGSEYLPLAAMIISRSVSDKAYDEVCARTKQIYNVMKKEHPMITSSEDCVPSALFAISGMSDMEIVRETEICYDNLKKKFGSGNFLQSLSQVLALSNDGLRTASDKCRDTSRLYDLLKEKKYRYSKSYDLASLGVLAMLDRGQDETVRDLIEVSDFLKTQYGYGFWGVGAQQRLAHAAMIVTGECAGASLTLSGTIAGGAVSMIAAQQAAISAAIVSSVMVATATRGSAK